ncbi:MAG: tetratricopeptide repeat protein [gamma proteobacterium symbiont of Bathyaustriella thionipta]|nr:tetratricopeptide repeat protein [gamma proteobacterium symbiont of Bathyaustriella thionipta]MCU7953727.1 tetratricopeptide repeat protein [gamma proteobacterium symbiont of Bathyaustriella thionipta]
MINIIVFILLCLAAPVLAGDFRCQHYHFEESKDWLCSHLERGVSKSRTPIFSKSEKTPVNDENTKKIEVLLNKAEQFYEEGNYPEVEQIYRHILKEHTDYAPVWINLAKLYSESNREHDALQTFYQALEIIPDNADIHHEAGLVQARLKLFSKAVISLAKAAVKEPENDHYSYVYGIALNSTQRPYKAIDVLLQAHQRHPDNMDVLGALFSINQDLNNHSNALFFAQKILLIEPANESIQSYVIKFKK